MFAFDKQARSLSKHCAIERRQMKDKRIAIIGISGLYAISGLEEAHWQRDSKPWGHPLTLS